MPLRNWKNNSEETAAVLNNSRLSCSSSIIITTPLVKDRAAVINICYINNSTFHLILAERINASIFSTYSYRPAATGTAPLHRDQKENKELHEHMHVHYPLLIIHCSLFKTQHPLYITNHPQAFQCIERTAFLLVVYLCHMQVQHGGT